MGRSPRGQARGHRRTTEATAPWARPVAARPILSGHQLCLHLADRGWLANAIGEGAATNRRQARRTVEHLETGEPTSTELGVSDAAVEYGSLTSPELRLIRAAAEEAAREAARRAAEQVITDRQEAERAEFRKRLKEFGG